MKIKKGKHSLGSLEAAVMEVLWHKEEASVREVLADLKEKPAYTTVMTVMSRLAEKGILRRRLNDSGSYIYRPAKTKSNFLKSASKKIINNLLNNFGEVAVAQFFDILEGNDRKELAKWRRKLKKMK